MDYRVLKWLLSSGFVLVELDVGWFLCRGVVLFVGCVLCRGMCFNFPTFAF